MSKGDLINEYNIGFLNADDLKPYIGLGLLGQQDYNNLVSKAPSNPLF